MAATHHVITPPTTVFPRLEIKTFVKNPVQFSLFIRAVQEMQKKRFASPTSFEAIGAIHGQPYVPYDDSTTSDDWTPAEGNDQWGGYCQHGSILFPPWHRPYVLLIEQSIRDSAREIAVTDSEREAADQLRHPYWDWLDQETLANGVPNVLTDDQVEIQVPKASGGVETKRVDNPLKSFTVHETLGSPGYRPVEAGFKTHRSADLDISVRRGCRQWRRNIGTVMSNPVYFTFSNHYAQPDGEESADHYEPNSLEGIHDSVHGYVGGRTGAMGDPNLAAYDPIFFMHHCQVDRLLAIWQQTHTASDPVATVGSNKALDGTFTLPDDAEVDAKTSLWPFRKAQAAYWNSIDCWDIHQLGYTYPGIHTEAAEPPKPLMVAQPLAMRRPQLAARAGAGAAAAGSEAGSSTAASPLPPAASVPAPRAVIGAAANAAQRATVTVRPDTGAEESDAARQRAHVLRSFLAEIQPPTNRRKVSLVFPKVEKRRLGGPFQIVAYVNKPDATKDTRRDDPHYAGELTVFARGKTDPCKQCQRVPFIRGEIDITDALEELGFDPDEVDVATVVNNVTVFAVRAGSGERLDSAAAAVRGSGAASAAAEVSEQQLTLAEVGASVPVVRVIELEPDATRAGRIRGEAPSVAATLTLALRSPEEPNVYVFTDA